MNPYGTTVKPTANNPENTGIPVKLPTGETIQLPLTAVKPYIADVTRFSQSRLGMIDLNPNGRPSYDDLGKMVNNPRVLGPLAHNYSADGTEFAPGAFSDIMWASLQHIDSLIQKKVVANPRFWHDRIPRGQFQLHNGVVHQSRIFRAGLEKYAGLDEWEPIDPVPSIDNDPCKFPKHDAYTYAFDQMAWSGMRASWGSRPICSNTFRYIEDAAQQLALVLEVGMERGVQMQEVFNRDTYLSKATDFGRSYVMTKNFRGLGSPRYFYDPFVKFGAVPSAANKIADQKLVDKAFIVVDASKEIEPVNWSVLDKVHELLKLRCPDAALGTSEGEPYFGLMVNSEDVDNSIEGDEKMYREWLEAKPLALIQKYDLSPKAFRRWAIVSDGNQLRFKIKHFIESYDSDKFGGVGAELDGKPVYIACAVDPFIPDPVNKGINGGPLPIENMDYIEAELAIAPVFMNDVLTNLFETGDVNLGNETHFGAYPALNGRWGWKLSPMSDDDPFQQTGKFYGLFAIHQKPEPRIRDVISFLYRRCKETIRARCPIESKRVNPDAEVTTHVVAGTENARFRTQATALGDVVIAKGATFDVLLAKGQGPLYVGEDRTLKVGTTEISVKVVDVTAYPYVTVANKGADIGWDDADSDSSYESGETGVLAELFDLAGSAVKGGIAYLAGKKLANAQLV